VSKIDNLGAKCEGGIIGRKKLLTRKIGRKKQNRLEE